MKFPYYSPNFGLFDLFRALFCSSNKGENDLIEYYKQITGKNYVFLTNSCRTAQYLAYKALENQGEVITSALTCKVAIDPIEESGNKPVFADITIDDLNINTNDIESRITTNTIAIQAIHLGGVSCNMARIVDIAKKNKLTVIEDCAQSLGSYYKNKHTGSFGEIACFSLIKNAYGIGGGVFATDRKSFFDKALSLNSTFGKVSPVLLSYRAIRNILDTYRSTVIGQLLYKAILSLKKSTKSYKTISNQLNQISRLETKIASIQLSKFIKLHKTRNRLGETLVTNLIDKNLLVNNQLTLGSNSFSKFFIYNPLINSKKQIILLHQNGIEAMHLEHTKLASVQDWVLPKEEAIEQGLLNYTKVHSHLVSLPLIERFNEEDLDSMVNILEKTLQA